MHLKKGKMIFIKNPFHGVLIFGAALLFITLVSSMMIMETRSNSLKSVRKYDFEFIGNLLRSDIDKDMTLAFRKVSEAFKTERYRTPFFPIVLLGSGTCLENDHPNAFGLCNELQKFDPCQNASCEIGRFTPQTHQGQTMLTYKVNDDYLLVAKDEISAEKWDYLTMPFENFEKSFTKMSEITGLIFFKIAALALAGLTAFYYWIMYKAENRDKKKHEYISSRLQKQVDSQKAELASNKEELLNAEKEKGDVFISLNLLRARHYDLETEVALSESHSSMELEQNKLELERLEQEISDKNKERRVSNDRYKKLLEHYARLKADLESKQAEKNSLTLTLEDQVKAIQKELRDERESNRKLLNQLKDIWKEGSEFKRKRKVETRFIQQEAVFTITQAFLALEQYVNKLSSGEISKNASFADKIRFIGDKGYVSREDKNKLHRLRDARNRWMHDLIHPDQELLDELIIFMKEKNITLKMW